MLCWADQLASAEQWAGWLRWASCTAVQAVVTRLANAGGKSGWRRRMSKLRQQLEAFRHPSAGILLEPLTVNIGACAASASLMVDPIERLSSMTLSALYW